MTTEADELPPNPPGMPKDGPGELPPAQELAPPAGLPATPPAGEEPAPVEREIEAAFKTDPRNAIFAKRTELLKTEQLESDGQFAAGRAAGLGHHPAEEDAIENVADTGDQYVTVKVYGEERQVPRDEVDSAGGIVAYQKAAAVTEKANRARERETLTAERERLERIQANLRQGLDENGQPLSRPAQPSPPTGVKVQIPDDMVDAATKGIYSGDENEARTGLRGLLEKTAEMATQAALAAINPEQLVEPLAERVEGRIQKRQTERDDQRDLEDANKVFRDNFKDIAADPDMFVWAQGLAGQLAADPANAGKSRVEIATMVGQRIQSKLRPKATGDTLEARRGIKRTLERRPEGQQRAPEETGPKVPTGKEYIEQLRRNSGSNSAPR